MDEDGSALDALEGVGTSLKSGELDPMLSRFVRRMGVVANSGGGGGGGGGCAESDACEGKSFDEIEAQAAAARLTFDDFAEEHWHVFDEDGSDDGEQTHEAHQVFVQWSELFERETEAFLEEEKTDVGDFYERAQVAKEQGSDASMVLDIALSTLSFSVFSGLMREYAKRKRQASVEAADMGF